MIPVHVSVCAPPSGRERLLPGGQAAHAAAEQARLGHQLRGRRQRLQEGRSTRGASPSRPSTTSPSLRSTRLSWWILRRRLHTTSRLLTTTRERSPTGKRPSQRLSAGRLGQGGLSHSPHTSKPPIGGTPASCLHSRFCFGRYNETCPDVQLGVPLCTSTATGSSRGCRGVGWFPPGSSLEAVDCSSANKCLLKVAAYAAQLEQYQKAIEIYEQVGTNTMDNPLLKYSAKEYFFKAALCHFIVDELNAKLALEKYEEMFPAFTDSRECKLLKKLLEAHEEQNCEAYTEAVKEFDSISRLDQWLTTMLLRIKKSIQGEGDGDLK
ncbi:uncharacterized protein AAGF69_001741 isoform 2-T2 [Amazona ochrocephala]